MKKKLNLKIEKKSNMITIINERIFKISSENLLGNSDLKETDIIIFVKKILGERKDMPRIMELKFTY